MEQSVYEPESRRSTTVEDDRQGSNPEKVKVSQIILINSILIEYFLKTLSLLIMFNYVCECYYERKRDK